MNREGFVIEKNMDGHVVKLVKGDEVWEIDNFQTANEICEVLNTNTDSGCVYKTVPIGLVVTKRYPGVTGVETETIG